jgi:hypothetical protein
LNEFYTGVGMSILNDLKNIDPQDLRKEAEKLLQWAYAHNHISISELEKRLEILNRTEKKTQILALIEDLPSPETGEPSSGNYQNSQEVGNDRFFTLLGSHVKRGTWNVPAELEVTAILGSQELDFRDARFHPGTTIMKATVFMGNIDIKFPPGVRVTSKGIPILGSIENRVRSESNGPLIHIEGFCMLGSIDARTKK